MRDIGGFTGISIYLVFVGFNWLVQLRDDGNTLVTRSRGTGEWGGYELFKATYFASAEHNMI